MAFGKEILLKVTEDYRIKAQSWGESKVRVSRK